MTIKPKTTNPCALAALDLTVSASSAEYLAVQIAIIGCDTCPA